MKTWNKALIVLITVFIFTTVFGISVFATDVEADASPEATVSLADIEVVFKYTSDSVISDGLTYRTYIDPVSNQASVEIIPDFGIGYTIYDDSDTETIDGIRINGEEVTSLTIPISSDSPTLRYEVDVRTVYAEGAPGTLAQILDGTYDYSKLITNPIVIFQLIYWVAMAISGVIGIFVAARSKKLKVKTSQEIASKVDDSVEILKERIVEVVTDVVKAEVLPLAQASVKSGKEAVKAILLSTSKSKDAPSAILDVFKESSDIDISNIVDEVREELSKSITAHAEQHSANAATLHNIATNVIQEDVDNAKETAGYKPHKSLF